MNKNLYEDPGLLEDEDQKKTVVDKTISKKTIKDVWKEFRNQLLAPRNLITFIILLLIFYSSMIYKEVIDIPAAMKHIPYFLLAGAVLASVQAGKPNWNKITTWFIIGVVSIFIYGTFNNLEKKRSGDKKGIGQEFYNVIIGETKKAEAKIPPQIIPQTSYGWKVDNSGNLVANLQIGEEVTKVFRMSEEGYSTPYLVLPPEGYRLRFDHLQTIIVEEKGRGKKIVHPDDHYNMGNTQGEYRKIKFTALKGGAEIITTLRRKKV